MNSSRSNAAGPPGKGRSVSSLYWITAVSCLLITLLILFLPRPKIATTPRAAATNSASFASPGLDSAARNAVARHRPSSPSAAEPAKTAEEIVGAKLAQFARSRRGLAYARARQLGVEVPKAVDEFFDAVESGNWDEIEARFKVIKGTDASAGHAAGRPPGVNELWCAVIDAYGAAEQVHLWPAQKLLDYGQSLLGSLRPGMVYVGGTDNGRWIPELLNDTSDGEQHIVLTQNGLADGKYLEYLDATAAANLLAAHNYTAEAEQAYRLSSQLWPGNPEPAGGLAALLERAGHADQARQVLDDFARRYPDQRSAVETLWTASLTQRR